MRKDKFNEVVKSYLYSIYSKNLKEKQIDQISKKICSLFVNNKIPQKSLQKARLDFHYHFHQNKNQQNKLYYTTHIILL